MRNKIIVQKMLRMIDTIGKVRKQAETEYLFE